MFETFLAWPKSKTPQDGREAARRGPRVAGGPAGPVCLQGPMKEG